MKVIALDRNSIIDRLSNGRSIQICVSNNFNIYLHPTSSHYELRSVLGLDHDDIIVEGNCSIIFNSKLAVRLKSPRQLASDVFQTSFEGHGITYDSIDYAIQEWYRDNKNV